MGVWDEAKHPRGFGGKFGHGTGTAKAPVKKTARSVFASADHAELHKKTVVQLRQDAKTSGLKGHSRTRKADLVDALVVHKRGSTPQKSAPAAAPKKTAREVMQAKPAIKPAPKPAAKSPTKALERKTTSTGKLQPHVSGDGLRELDAKTKAAKKDLSPGQLKAVEQWTSGKGMVRKIQTGQVSAETSTNLDEAMKTLPKVDGLVYRAVSSHGGSSQFAADLRPGQVLDLGAPVSTSIDPRQSGSFGTNLYEIESPAASYLAGVGSKFGYEKEAVLAPGRYEVVSSEYASIGLGKNNAKVLVVRLRDVTEGDRSWKPTSGTDFKLHEPKTGTPDKPKTGAEAVHAAPYLRESGGPARDGVDTKNIDSALTYYKGAGYLGINEDLRKGVKNGREQEDIAAIDAGMGPLTSDVEVYRGIHKASKVFGPAWNEHDVTGLTWRDDAFVSVSGDGRASGSAFSSAGGAIMRIRAPKGTEAVGVTDRAEMELLLGRGLTYRVVKDNGVVDGKRRLDVEVVA